VPDCGLNSLLLRRRSVTSSCAQLSFQKCLTRRHYSCWSCHSNASSLASNGTATCFFVTTAASLSGVGSARRDHSLAAIITCAGSGCGAAQSPECASR